MRYALNINDKASLDAVKRLKLERKKKKMTVFNYIHSATYKPEELSVEGTLQRPQIILNTSVAGLATTSEQYNLINLNAETTKYEESHLDRFIYTLNDDEVVGMVKAGLYRGDYQSFLNDLNHKLKGKEFAVENGVAYYEGKVNDVEVLAYESQDVDYKSVSIEKALVRNFNLEKEVLELGATREVERISERQAEKLRGVLLHDKLDLGSLENQVEPQKEETLDKSSENDLTSFLEKTEPSLDLDDKLDVDDLHPAENDLESGSKETSEKADSKQLNTVESDNEKVLVEDKKSEKTPTKSDITVPTVDALPPFTIDKDGVKFEESPGQVPEPQVESESEPTSQSSTSEHDKASEVDKDEVSEVVESKEASDPFEDAPYMADENDVYDDYADELDNQDESSIIGDLAHDEDDDFTL
ncbi:hypothetical protein CYR83_02945 [Ligilactobacillus agilis]|uniref:Uncharacterized protein n=1 Tax=Ligilactobacillus agilis TaxID=1601 RepID=A0A2I2A929_9LACO|nr:hypothetical protein [Ligilactobacillus agilis]PLA75894.1 hypothetical protein CYR79_09010 [Ligilactobacillus agilis]PLA83554.1 hypothetical protein CYR83_02945 [Ligilactobacillus agilis]